VADSHKDLGQIITTEIIELMATKVIEVATRAIEVAIKTTRFSEMKMKVIARSSNTETRTGPIDPEVSTETKTLEANTSLETRTEVMMRVSSRFVAAATIEASSKVGTHSISSDPTHPSSKLAT